MLMDRRLPLRMIKNILELEFWWLHTFISTCFKMLNFICKLYMGRKKGSLMSEVFPFKPPFNSSKY